MLDFVVSALDGLYRFPFLPKYKYRNSRRYETGQVCINADIRDNRIFDIKFSGDFLALKSIAKLETVLVGCTLLEAMDFLIKNGNNFILGVSGSDLTTIFQ